MTILTTYRSRLLFGVATGVFSACLTGIGVSESLAQSSSATTLPPVAVDEPRQRPRVVSTKRQRVAPRQTVRAAPPQPAAAPPPQTTMGTTRTIGAVAPAYAGGQVAQGGTLGLLGNVSVMNAPFSVQNYTSKLIEDQQARSAGDVLQNDASVRTTNNGNGGYDDTFQIRGFQVDGADVGLNGMYGLVSRFRAPSYITERLQLLKGPAALLNGIAPNNTIGGSINIITKRAPEEAFLRATPFFMSAANFGVHVDTARRFGDQKEWGVRFNGVVRDGELNVKDSNVRSGLAALGVDYRSERFRWTLDAISQNDNTNEFRPQISIPGTFAFVPRPPDPRTNWYKGSKLTQRDNTIMSQAEFDVTDWLTAYAGIGYRDGFSAQDFPSATLVVAPPATYTGALNVTQRYYDEYQKVASGNVGFRSNFNTGPVNHKVNVAYSAFDRELGFGFGTNTGPALASNLYNPLPLPPLNIARMTPGKSAEVLQQGVSVSDTMSFLNEMVMITGGFRYQKIDADNFSNTTGVRTGGYSSDAVSPLAGIVFKPVGNVALYFNYAEGLSQGAVVPQTQSAPFTTVPYANAGQTLAPFKSKQLEGGVKVDWGTITTTASYFEITRPSLITLNPGLPIATQAYDGEQNNHGIELNAYGLVMPGLRGMVSYAYLIPELTKVSSTLLNTLGKDAVGQPRDRFSASLDWDIPGIVGLAVNGRVIYTGKSYLDAANTVSFPSWTRYDVGVRYATKVGGTPVTFRASVENIFDKAYWTNAGTYSAVAPGRTYLVSAAIDLYGPQQQQRPLIYK